MCTELLMSAFNISAGMLSKPADLFFSRDLIAFSTSASVGGSMFISSCWSAGGNVGGCNGEGLLRSCRKCSTHLVCWSSVVVSRQPFKSLIWWFITLNLFESCFVVS